MDYIVGGCGITRFIEVGERFFMEINSLRALTLYYFLIFNLDRFAGILMKRNLYLEIILFKFFYKIKVGV
jgi:hypothetical protein